jgi:hypothetical protein
LLKFAHPFLDDSVLRFWPLQDLEHERPASNGGCNLICNPLANACVVPLMVSEEIRCYGRAASPGRRPVAANLLAV